jgi:Tol biopolymer transport system component/DNA-binding winged helix-turn-helix (wHTH) protein
MENPIRQIYTFGAYAVDVAERQLLRDGDPVSLPPKVFDTLLVLVENRGRILEKDVLMNKIWPDSFVEESSLAQYIFQLRKALGDDAAEHRFIETIPKRGYRFMAPVQLENLAAVAVEPRNGTAILAPPPTLPRLSLVPEAGMQWANGESHHAVLPHQPFSLFTNSTRHADPIQTKSRLIKFGWVAVLFVTILAGLFIGGMWFTQTYQNSVPSSANVQITKLTSTGRALTPAISPDGKYVAYVADDLGKQSMWIRQTETLSNVQVLAPAEVSFQGLTFSPDGNYLYYVVYKMPKHVGVLYRVPILGGTSQKILEDVDTAITFAPDGQRFAFVRQYPGTLETAVMVAHTDGSNEQKLVTRKSPKSFAIDGLSWSPNGALIAVSSSSIGASGPSMQLVGIRIKDGAEICLSDKVWGNLKQVVWRKDGRGLMAIGWQQAATVVANQIWYIPYPEGEPRPVTNDLINYSGLSIAADTGKVVTTQSTKVSRLWLVPENDAERATQAASVGIDNFSEKLGLDWLPNGKLIYGSRASGNADLWLMDPEGSPPKQLTVDNTLEGQPTVSADGRYIAFLSNRAGTYNIWRMNADGTQLQRLTKGPWENTPSFSPDGKWVVYNGVFEEKPVLWKVPAEGGEPVRLTDTISLRPAVSPDGKMVAHLHLDEQTQRMRLAVIPLEGEAQVKMFEQSIPAPHIVNWSPDGQMVTYVDTHDGVSNIWGQPLDGSPSKPLTHFKSDSIFRFAWSPDGKKLACERGFYINDVVLISNFS